MAMAFLRSQAKAVPPEIRIPSPALLVRFSASQQSLQAESSVCFFVAIAVVESIKLADRLFVEAVCELYHLQS